ncbi:MAG: DedA family protein [Candidatus Kapabacteria bacterium]|nr:DedA family protein [Candidatus Kapabacteria bacterium]
MLETLVTFFMGLPPWGVLALTFFIAYIENLFPPAPSDVVLVFIGTIVGVGVVGFVPTLIAATAGSVLGFSTAYALGRRYGNAIADSPLVPFITRDLIAKVERWFDKYQGLIIIANRFLAGTRAVIAFVAGISRLPFPRTVIYCAVSAAIWNAILLTVGVNVGSRWRDVDQYIAAYGWVVTGLIVVGLGIWYYRKRKKR